MLQDIPQAKTLQFIEKYYKGFIILLLAASNIYQYTTAQKKDEVYTQFYQQVYTNETTRVTKWEDIVLTLRAQPSH